MKRKITQYLISLLVLPWALPASAALEYEISVDTVPVAQKAWEYINTSTNYVAKSIAVANGIVYTIKPGKDEITYWDPINNKTGTIETGYTAGQVGWGIASDDYGNIIFPCKFDMASRARYFCVYKSSGEFGVVVSATDKKEHDVTGAYTSSNGGVSHYINAAGNCYDGTGYIYIYPQSQSPIRLNISSGKFNDVTDYTLSGATITAGTEYSFMRVKVGEFLIYGRDCSIYDCTISSKTITATKLISSSDHDNAADIEYLQGHRIIVYNKGDYDYYKVELKDLTKNKILATLHTLPSDAGTETAYRAKGVGSYSRLEKSEDDNTLYLYTFAPRRGFKKYKITATATNNYTDPVSSLSASINIVSDGTKQAVLTWTAPSTNASHVANYKIFRGDTEIASVESDVFTYTDTEELMEGETTYKVIPVYDNDVTVGTDVIVTIVNADIKLTAMKVEDGVQVGRQDAQLSWNAVDDAVSYDVYCDGALIANTAKTTYTQTDLNKLKTYTYKVVPIYDGQKIALPSNEASVTTDIIAVAPVLSTPTDHSGYATTELLWKQPYGIIPDYYNVYRDKILVSSIKAFDYIDANLTEGEHVWTVESVYSNGAKAQSSPAGTDIAARQLSKVTYIVEEIYDYEMTEITSKPDDFASATNYRQGAYYNGYWYVMGTSGNILKFPAEDPRSGYTVANTISANQSVGIAIDNNGNIVIRGMNSLDTESAMATNYLTRLENAVVYSNDFASNKNVALYNMNDAVNYDQTLGRADYYSASGNLLSDTGYLYYIYNNDNRVIRETIVNGVRNISEILTLDAYNTESTENYVFPIGTGGNYIATLRNQIVIDNNGNIVTNSLSRASRAGGTAIDFDGKRFILLPDEIGDATKGNFIVSFMDVASTDYSALIPVMQKNYAPSESANVATLANAEADVAGNWLFAEVGTWDAGDCIYIYQYVPGVRFAKYRLYSSDAFPATDVNIEISTTYNDDNTEILSFDSKISWSAPQLDNDFNYDVTYSLQLKDSEGNVVKNKNGNETTIINAVDGQSEYTVTDYSNLDYGVIYTAYLTINYTTETDARSSETTTNSASHSYPVYETESPVVTIKFNPNYDKLDPNSWIMKYVNTTIDFNTPNYNDVEPISYYEVYYTADGGSTFNKLENFILNDGNATVSSVIPADFDFNSTAYVLLWEEFQYKTLDENGDIAYTEDTKSQNYNYIIRTVYAANATNQSITKTADSGLAELNRIETGVDNLINDNSDVKVYPIPAQSVIYVNVPEAIDFAEIYSVSGAVVKRVDGNGESSMTIDIEELTAGYYFLKVNDRPMMKIVKK